MSIRLAQRDRSKDGQSRCRRDPTARAGRQSTHVRKHWSAAAGGPLAPYRRAGIRGKGSLAPDASPIMTESSRDHSISRNYRSPLGANPFRHHRPKPLMHISTSDEGCSLAWCSMYNTARPVPSRLAHAGVAERHGRRRNNNVLVQLERSCTHR